MPFIRYKTEDTFVIEDGKIKDVNGRSSDILVSKDGSRLPGVNFYSWIDKKMPAIKLFQIIQKQTKISYLIMFKILTIIMILQKIY